MPGWMGDRPARIPESEYTNGGGGARVAVLAHREIQNPSGADQSNATRGEITRRGWKVPRLRERERRSLSIPNCIRELYPRDYPSAVLQT